MAEERKSKLDKVLESLGKFGEKLTENFNSSDTGRRLMKIKIK